MYWVSCIIQESPGSKPWLCACSEPCQSRAAAMELAKKYARTFRCLSVWIDMQGVGGTECVFHRAFINSMGEVSPWTETESEVS